MVDAFRVFGAVVSLSLRAFLPGLRPVIHHTSDRIHVVTTT